MTTRRERHLDHIRPLLLLTTTLGLLCTVAVIVQMSFLSTIVSDVFLGHWQLAAVSPVLVSLLLAGLLRGTLNGAREGVAGWSAIRVKSRLRERLFAHLLRLGPAYAQGEHTGELVTAATEGIERLDAYISRYLPQTMLSVLAPVCIVLALVPVDLPSALLLLATGPIIVLLMVLVGTYAQGTIQRQWDGLSRMGAHFLDVVQGLPTVILFGREDAESQRVARIGERYRERTLKALRMAFLSGMVLEFLIAGAIGVVAVTLGVRLIDGSISFSRAFLVLLLAPEFYRPLRDLGAHRHAGMEGKAALARIAEILDTPPPVATAHAPSLTSSLDVPAPPHIGARPLAVEVCDVSYTYTGSPHRTLNGVTLRLEPGTETALVGRSGAGKSTLVNLLLRYLDMQDGSISVNGLPLRALPPTTWRNHVALVPQRPHLFAGSVRDNLRLGNPAATDGALAFAAEQAGAAEFIARLPRGYDTAIGERGARLSAGQAQRLAIARAFLKDAPLLILDEPTSCLDPDSEALIRAALRELARGRTVLVVAHRLATVRTATKIVVLEHGRVVEEGCHDELLHLGGAYARLVGLPLPSSILEVPA